VSRLQFASAFDGFISCFAFSSYRVDSDSEHAVMIVGDSIGRGAFGNVFEAWQGGRKIAVKIIDKKKLATANVAFQRVHNEIKIHRSLDHEHIARFLWFREDLVMICIGLEYCGGGNMADELQVRQRLSHAECRGVMDQLTAAVAYLHGRDIAHRDLKLANLLLDSRKNVKLADFGFATFVGSSSNKTICGTPNFIAPEVLLSDGSSGDAIARDLWSLGCLLYSFLVGEPPFESATVTATLERVKCVDYDIPGYVSDDAQRLIESLVESDPSQRLTAKQIQQHPFLDRSRTRQPLCEQNNDHHANVTASERRIRVRPSTFRGATFHPSTAMPVSNNSTDDLLPSNAPMGAHPCHCVPHFSIVRWNGAAGPVSDDGVTLSCTYPLEVRLRGDSYSRSTTEHSKLRSLYCFRFSAAGHQLWVRFDGLRVAVPSKTTGSSELETFSLRNLPLQYWQCFRRGHSVWARRMYGLFRTKDASPSVHIIPRGQSMTDLATAISTSFKVDVHSETSAITEPVRIDADGAVSFRAGKDYSQRSSVDSHRGVSADESQVATIALTILDNELHVAHQNLGSRLLSC